MINIQMNLDSNHHVR